MNEDRSNEVNQWTPNQHKFLDWLSLPATLREPLTQQMLAKELHLAEETLSRWKKLPGFEEERQRRILARLGQDSHEIMHAFIDQAKRGEFQHIKMYFEMMGWYVPKIAPTTPDGKQSVPLIRLGGETSTEDL